MARRKKAELERVFRAGNSMSNLCFNLSQLDAIPADYRKTMKECYLEWDDARLAARRAGSSSSTESTKGRS